MDHWFSKALVTLFWLASMLWLVSTKIAPLLHAPQVPDQRVFRPEAEPGEGQVRWSIRWNDRIIGHATTETQRRHLGFGQVTSVLRLERLPARELAHELFGSIASSLLEAGGSPLPDLELSLTVSSHMEFDPFGGLQRFETSVDVDSLGELLRLKGRLQEDQLTLEVLSGKDAADVAIASPSGRTGERRLFQQQIRLPSEALVADALSPQPRLSGLRVGQSWQFRAYRPFPPQRPFRLVRAEVVREELIPWEDDIEPAKVVTFSDAGGSGLTTSREPLSTLWVRDDGSVLRQQMKLGQVTIEFRRVPWHQGSGPARL